MFAAKNVLFVTTREIFTICSVQTLMDLQYVQSM